MPLEDLVGSDKYIDDLQPLWPLGTEYLDGADNHMRGIKNVLKNTFPKISGPVTRTQDEINRGTLPVGSRALFIQATAPVGWTQISTGTHDWMVTIAPDSANGGVSGGAHNPLVMDKVPAHKHRTQGSTGNESAGHTHEGTTQGNNRGHTHSGQTAASGSAHTHEGWSNDNDKSHTHSGTTNNAGNHSHQYQRTEEVSFNTGYGSAAARRFENLENTSSNGNHSHGFTTGNQNQNHRHWVKTGNGSADHQHSFNTATENQNHTHGFSTGSNKTNHTHPVDLESADNANASNWSPYYMRAILCERTS